MGLGRVPIATVVGGVHVGASLLIVVLLRLNVASGLLIVVLHHTAVSDRGPVSSGSGMGSSSMPMCVGGTGVGGRSLVVGKDMVSMSLRRTGVAGGGVCALLRRGDVL